MVSIMDLTKKIEILTSSAKYDASCSSSGSSRKSGSGLGNTNASGICHSFTSDGRCVSLLKILLTNICIYDCKYCINRRSNNIERTILKPDEIADITINFYKRNYIEGLFLSSGIIKSPDYTINLLIETLTILRKKYNFNGYIHAKTPPGASKDLIDRLGLLADRLSINIEMPSNSTLKLLAPDKNGEKIFDTMKYIKEKKKDKKFTCAGQTTQMIIGASKDNDYQIMKISEGLYEKYKLKRVYYSAYIPVNNDNLLPSIEKPPLKRENRLYQADWLIRYYGFKSNELLNENNPNFHLHLDPKLFYALNNFEKYPVEINNCNYETLLRVPGIGITSAKKIISTRKVVKLDFDTLKRIGVVLKRAKYFITCNGKYYEEIGIYQKERIINKLLSYETIKQLSLFGEEHE